MKKRGLSASFVGVLSVIIILVPALAVEKLNLGGAVKMFPPYFLPGLAAQEKGFWKENGLEAEIILFGSGAAQVQAMAGGHLDLGGGSSGLAVQAAAAGVSLVIISECVTRGAGFFVWVMADSPLKRAEDLSGRRLGTNQLRTGPHAYGRAMAKKLGIDVKFVASGGIRESIVLLKTGKIDAGIGTLGEFVSLMVSGEARPIAAVNDYLPKEWVEHVVFSRRDLVQGKPDTLKRALRALLQGANFLKENRDWTLARLRQHFGYSEEAAKVIYEKLITNIELGRIDRRAVENVRNLLIDYELVPREKMPPLDHLYTREFSIS